MKKFIGRFHTIRTSTIFRFHSSMVPNNLEQTPKLLNDEYIKAMRDLNRLQSNSKTTALAKYKNNEEILPLFAKQLTLSGVKIEDLDRLSIIHVTGTKGKGSTCAFVESILHKAGIKTGFYNSPHLVRVNERIRINSSPIDNDCFSKHFRHVYDRLAKETQDSDISMPSYFSFMTILAFHIFLEEKVDCAVIEVGIGGEYDPTNIVRNPIACGITTLDYDHTSILGTSLENIANAKAGIIKRGVPVYTIPQVHHNTLDIIERRAKELGSPFFVCKEMRNNVELGIQGTAQLTNASLAASLAHYYLVGRNQLKLQSDEEQNDLSRLPSYFRDGLKKCFWPGRCQIIKHSGLTFFLDGAHTRLSMVNCLEWFLKASSNNDSDSCRILMINIIGEREKKAVMEPLTQFNCFEKVIFTTSRVGAVNDSLQTYSAFSDKTLDNAYLNMQTWKDLLNLGEDATHDKLVIMTSTSESIRYLIELHKLNGRTNYHILVTGSLHLVGAVLEAIQENKRE